MNITIKELIECIQEARTRMAICVPSTDYENETGFYEDMIDYICPHLLIDKLSDLHNSKELAARFDHED